MTDGIGSELKKNRKGKGLKMCDVAAKLGVTVQFISNVEAGRNIISPPYLRRWADILSMDATELAARLCARSVGNLAAKFQKYSRLDANKILEEMVNHLPKKEPQREIN